MLYNGYLSVFKTVIMKQTLKGYLTQAFSSLRYKAKRRGDKEPSFTKLEFELWMHQNGVYLKWINYIESDYKKSLIPSVNRINDYGVYEFSNMELITWGENHIKGINGLKHHKNSHNQNLTKPVFIWNKEGVLQKECKNYKEAAEYLGCHRVSISRATTGARKTIKNHILTNSKTFTLH